jgi:hypothetical protein
MRQTSTPHHGRRAGDDRREALTWLARALDWERRLGELRPSGAPATEHGRAKAAA